MDDENMMHKDFKIRLENENKARVVCDYIAGMTDNYAREIYKKYKIK